MQPNPPIAYLQYERRWHVNNWWYRTAPDQPWQLCRTD
jgi:hypothetical protein